MKVEPKDPYGAARVAPSRHCRKDSFPVGTVVVRCKSSRFPVRYARFIKVRGDGPKDKRWKPYARWWWEKNRGPVPEGRLVLHKDGDDLNDAPGNLILGTPGMKLVLAHRRDPAWSREQHRRAAAGCADFNRRQGRINRAKNFLAKYWYPVVDELGVILNVPFRRRKRLLACFGHDVSRYPVNGVGKKPGSVIRKLLRGARIAPTRGRELSLRRYSTYCFLDPATRTCSGPMSGTLAQLVGQLERMDVWEAAQKYAKKDLRERR